MLAKLYMTDKGSLGDNLALITEALGQCEKFIEVSVLVICCELNGYLIEKGSLKFSDSLTDIRQLVKAVEKKNAAFKAPIYIADAIICIILSKLR